MNNQKVAQELLNIAKTLTAAGNEDLPKKYKEKKAEISKMLKSLEAKLAKHEKQFEDDGMTNWGFMGDLGHIAQTLHDLTDEFLQ